MTRWGALAAVGCQPWRTGDAVCDGARPGPDQVVIRAFACEDQAIDGGEGLPGADGWVATEAYRLVIRHPESALTLAGVGGFTIVDAASWDSADLVHEIAPLVGGGWLDVLDWEPHRDGYTVHGVITSLPDQPSPRAGELASVRWQFTGDAITADGSDGWYLHPRGIAAAHARSLSTDTALMWFPPIHADLGGALRLEPGPLRLGAPLPTLAAAGAARVAGVADGTHLEWLDGDVVLARAPLNGVFDLVGPDASGVRAVGPAAPSPVAPLSLSVDLRIGPRGALRVTPTQPRSVRFRWAADDGRSGEAAVPPAGGVVALGAGRFRIDVDAPFGHAPAALIVDVPVGATIDAPLDVGPRRGDRVAVGVGLPSDRSRDWRGTDFVAAHLADAAGFDLAAFLVDADTTAFASAALLTHGGTRLTGPGWRVEAWPVRFAPRKNAHGAPQSVPTGAEHALELLSGGAGATRHLRVDVATLAALPPPHLVARPPTLVELPPPDDTLTAWEPWFSWPDAGHAPVPTGPVTWVPVADRERVTTAEIDQSLSRGDVVAGDGAWIDLWVDGGRPGDRLAAPPQRVAWAPRDGDVDRVAVVTNVGRWWGPAEGSVDLPTGVHWLTVVALSDDGWAVAGPVYGPRSPATEARSAP